MTNLNVSFKSAFWESDFVSQIGYDTLSSHIKNGQKSCKWLEDYIRQRARAEEEYSKTLLKLCKNPTEAFGSLGTLLNEFRNELEVEATLHANIASRMLEDCAKINEFRERQKEERRRHDENLHKLHKTKADLYRSMVSSRHLYDSKLKVSQKADQDYQKLKEGGKSKEIDKAKKQAQHSEQAATRANELYKTALNQLEDGRRNWERHHIAACDDYEEMEGARICFMRDSIWLLANVFSDFCCRLDDSKEKVRLVAERCDEEEDIRSFVFRNGTCSTPLSPISYEMIGHFESDLNTASTSEQGLDNHPLYSRDVSALRYDENPNAEIVTYIALYYYRPQSDDEIALECGDSVREIEEAEQGWLRVLNLSSNLTGLVPLNYLRKCQN